MVACQFLSATMFSCKFCDFQDSRLSKKLKHAMIHWNITSVFHCDFNGCERTCQNETGLRSHLLRDNRYQVKIHGLHSVPSTQAVPALTCSVNIRQKQCNTYLELKRHLKEHLEKGVQVPCPFRPTCDSIFKNEVTFKSHLSKKHRIFRVNITACDEASQTLENDAGLPQHGAQGSLGSEESLYRSHEDASDVDMEVDFDLNRNDLEMSLALFFLKLEAVNHVPATTVQSIVEELKVINDLLVKANQKKLTEILRSHDLSNETIAEINNSVALNESLSPCLENLSSVYLRKEYYKRNLQFVEPKEYSFLKEDGTASKENFLCACG